MSYEMFARVDEEIYRSPEGGRPKVRENVGLRIFPTCHSNFHHGTRPNIYGYRSGQKSGSVGTAARVRINMVSCCDKMFSKHPDLPAQIPRIKIYMFA